MENTLIHLLQVALAGGFALLSVRYWKRSLNNKFQLNTNLAAYILFASIQIVACLSLVFFALDEHVIVRLQEYNFFGANSEGLWSFIGVQAIGSIIIYIVMNLAAHLFFNAIQPTEKGLYGEIEKNNWKPIILYGIVFVGFTIISASFALRQALIIWISNDSGPLPQLY